MLGLSHTYHKNQKLLATFIAHTFKLKNIHENKVRSTIIVLSSLRHMLI
jgi:hypothetical protein